MKIAIVHDWLNSFAGAMRVVHALHEMYPDAPIYTSVYDPKKAPQFDDAVVKTSYLQKVPLAKKKHQYFALPRQRAFEKFDFSDYDIVISSSGSEAKGIITDGKTLHINYCHAPTHYYWRNYEDYIKEPGLGPLDPLARIGLPILVNHVRKWDIRAAQRPDYIVTNSSFIQSEVKKYYNRESTVIHPPVATGRFKVTGKEKRHGFLIVGRQVPFKRFHLAVEACANLGLPLTVAGDGSENARLRKLAGPTVTFKTNVSDKEMNDLFTHAEGFIFPSEDDFGIVAAEALAAGTPVVAYGTGGSRDIVESGKTGVFFDNPTVQSLEGALKEFSKHKWDNKKIKKSADRFSLDRFKKEMQKFIDAKYTEHQKKLKSSSHSPYKTKQRF